MNILRAGFRILSDLSGIMQKVGVPQGLMWLYHIITNPGVILKSGNLSIADHRMGSGPYRVNYAPGISFMVQGTEAFSGIREMYVRDVYLQGGKLTLCDGDVVLDLGSNMGNFTNLALAHGGNIKVIAVEPNKTSNEAWRKSISLNPGFMERTLLIRAFIGTMGDKQQSLLSDDAYQGASWLSEDELLKTSHIEKIDFLKCDIEGGEFDLLKPGSKILKMARKVAIEVHQFAGNVENFLGMLEQEGFALLYIQRDPDGTVTVLGEHDDH